MILNNNKIDVQQEGENLQTTKMGISIDNEAAIIEIIVGFYSRKKESIVREYVSNSKDTTVDARNNSPIIVRLQKKEDGWYFSSEDQGMGINQELVDNVLSQFGKSTRTYSNDFIGSYGIGSKSGFCYSSFYIVTGRKNGIEGKWMFRRTQSGFTIDTIYNDIPTDKPNGSIWEIKINNGEEGGWSKAIREQLAYFENVYIIDEYNPIPEDYKIYETTDFKYSELAFDPLMHISIDNVYYTMDWKHLDIDPIHIPIALKFKLGDGIVPLPARESYYATVESREAILSKLKKVANFFIDKYNSENIEYKTWKEAYSNINKSDYFVNLNNTKFKINELKEYANNPILGISIIGYNSNHLKHLYTYFPSIIDIFESKGRIRPNTNYSKESCTLNLCDNIALVDHFPTGNFREYLKDQYISYKFFKIKSQRKLFEKNSEYFLVNGKNWVDALNLKNIPKIEWREYIKEAIQIQNEIIKGATDFRNFTIPKEWLDERKKKRIQNGSYVILNKQQGEITIAYNRKKIYNNDFIFDKTTYNINALYKMCYLTIYSTKENQEKLKYLCKIIPIIGKNYRVAIIGERDQKHVKNLHNFKTIQEFMDLPIVNKLVTAQRAAKVNEKIKSIFNNTDVDIIFTMLAHKYNDTYENFKKYIKLNEVNTNSALYQELEKYVQDNNLWDKAVISDIEKVESVIDNFSFLQYINIPRKGYSETREEYQDRIKDFKKIIHKFLLFEKIHNGHFEDWTMCPPVEQTITENITEEA